MLHVCMRFQKVLKKNFNNIPIESEVRNVKGDRYAADIITGGFPCQPFSVAGKRKGTDDDRYLWDETIRVIRECKPRWFIGENVEGIINIQEGVVFETVCTDLESEGYEVQPFIIPAAGVGAPHRRERVWIIATNTESKRTGQNDEGLWQRSSRISGGEGTSRSESPQSNVVNTVGNDERQEISRSDEETRKIQEEHRTEHSTTGQSSRTSAIRNGDNGYEKRINVADTNDEGVRTRIGGSDNDYETESRSWRADGTRSTSDDERHNSTSTEVEGMDVANTESSNRHDNEAITRDGEPSTQEIFGNGSSVSGESSWWHTEPNVGRVAHGIPGRVYRLKGLGNSIIPKIAEEIGKAIIEAEREE